MGTKRNELAEYLLLVKKISNITIKSQEHRELKEDVAHDAFLKLYRSEYFNNHDFNNEQDKKTIYSYISKTVKSCYLDHLQKSGIIRRLSKAEAEADSTGSKYQNIVNYSIEEVDEHEFIAPPIESPEQFVLARQVYHWIKNCYEAAASDMKDINRKNFIEAAFWRFNDFDFSLKDLARHLGYESSNPTQELKRFVSKVSLCTKPHGVEIDNPQEQISFLMEYLNDSGVNS
jgi:DNA-directed RNA polymerase specialized sigma24 family protein